MQTVLYFAAAVLGFFITIPMGVLLVSLHIHQFWPTCVNVINFPLVISASDYLYQVCSVGKFKGCKLKDSVHKRKAAYFVGQS